MIWGASHAYLCRFGVTRWVLQPGLAFADVLRRSWRTAEPLSDTDPAKVAPAMALFLLVGLILVLLGLLGGFILVRFARRYRNSLNRQRAAPTSSEDVWAMHKLPDYDDDQEPGSNGQEKG